MRWRPSLVRRLTVGFFFSQLLALSLALAALWPLSKLESEGDFSPSVAASMIGHDVELVAGRLRMSPAADFAGFAAASPKLWFIARARGRELRFGSVPPDIAAMLRYEEIETADLGAVPEAGPEGLASIERIDRDFGPLIIAVGGVDPRAVTFSAWLAYVWREDWWLVPLIVSIFGLAGGLIAIPIVVRGIRPTARAAAGLDPSRLNERLPERGVVKELLPLVGAVNGALQRLTDAFQQRRRFIADVAHELRTPLAILTMHVEALPPSDVRADLQRTVYRLGQMVGQMLDAERLALSGRRRGRMDLVELGREAVANIAPLAVASGYRIGFRSDNPRQCIEADAHAVARAFANLLGNAVAHGGGGGSIELYVSDDGCVEVSDEGPGIPAEARERVFEPFSRERWDRDGCGLGLHLVREIMRAHGGDATVATAARGAVFRLSFGG